MRTQFINSQSTFPCNPATQSRDVATPMRDFRWLVPRLPQCHRRGIDGSAIFSVWRSRFACGWMPVSSLVCPVVDIQENNSRIKSPPNGGKGAARTFFGVTQMSWDRPFGRPVPLPGGRPARTLRDAGDYIRRLPESERDRPEWRLAVQMLIDAAEGQGPMLFARIGIERAVEHARRDSSTAPPLEHRGRSSPAAALAHARRRLRA